MSLKKRNIGRHRNIIHFTIFNWLNANTVMRRNLSKMLASELIKELEQLICEFGDKPVCNYSDDYANIVQVFKMEYIDAIGISFEDLLND